MIECIGLPPAAGRVGGLLVGAERAPVRRRERERRRRRDAARPAARAASSRWYTGLVSPTALAKFASTARSSTTRHAPVGLPITLVSTAMCVPAPALAGAWRPRSRYGDAHVSFLVTEGERANGHARRQGGDRHRSGQRCRTRRGGACSPTTAPRSSSTTSADRSPAKAPTSGPPTRSSRSSRSAAAKPSPTTTASPTSRAPRTSSAPRSTRSAASTSSSTTPASSATR